MTFRDYLSQVLDVLAAEPPRTDVNRYAQLSPLAQALVDDHDAIALAEMLVKADDDLDRARRKLADRAAADSADAAAGSYAGRAEEAEQQRDAARETNRRLNLRAQQLESELTAYRRAIDTWEFTERGTYVPLRSITAMGKAAGVGFDGTRYEQHYERAERVEAQLAAVADLIADHEGDEWAAHPATTALRSILDEDEPGGTDPARWLHVVFTSPDETTANTSALAIRDHLAAEFPGVSMRISSNATEAGPLTPVEEARLAQSGVDTPGCDCGHQGMGISWHGDDCPWRRGVLGGAHPVATEATSLRTRLARALAGRAGSKAVLADGTEWDHMRAAWYAHADAVLTELERELAALAEYENAITWQTDCLACARTLDSSYAETMRAEKAEAATTRVIALYEQWVKAGAPPLGTSMARWWDARLVELRAVLNASEEAQ